MRLHSAPLKIAALILATALPGASFGQEIVDNTKCKHLKAYTEKPVSCLQCMKTTVNQCDKDGKNCKDFTAFHWNIKKACR